jgi:hypothetical protein
MAGKRTAAPARLFLALALLWMAALTWRLYPQFGDMIRVGGRLTTIASYLADTCGQRVGPAATTCRAETGAQAQFLLRREQGKSVLLILAPLFPYMVWWTARLLRERRRPNRSRASG